MRLLPKHLGFKERLAHAPIQSRGRTRPSQFSRIHHEESFCFKLEPVPGVLVLGDSLIDGKIHLPPLADLAVGDLALSEPLFTVRKHQAFRPVSTTAAFNTSIYGADGSLEPSQYTNKRLIGRSVWNSKWKLVIPGKGLLNDPNQGLSKFINSVKDVKLYFITYSYSGN